MASTHVNTKLVPTKTSIYVRCKLPFITVICGLDLRNLVKNISEIDLRVSLYDQWKNAFP